VSGDTIPNAWRSGHVPDAPLLEADVVRRNRSLAQRVQLLSACGVGAGPTGRSRRSLPALALDSERTAAQTSGASLADGHRRLVLSPLRLARMAGRGGQCSSCSGRRADSERTFRAEVRPRVGDALLIRVRGRHGAGAPLAVFFIRRRSYGSATQCFGRGRPIGRCRPVAFRCVSALGLTRGIFTESGDVRRSLDGLLRHRGPLRLA
jgi:hypothetical protein